MALQRRALTLIVLLLPFSLLAQQFSSAWSLGGTGIDYITQIEVDKNGDRIIAGYFSGSVKFGSTTLSSDGGVDLFIAKMDNKNSFKWVKQIGDSIDLDDTILEIATDKVDSEVPSPVAGKLVKQLFKEDEVAQVGDVIAIIETEAANDVVEEEKTPVSAPVIEKKPETKECFSIFA